MLFSVKNCIPFWYPFSHSSFYVACAVCFLDNFSNFRSELLVPRALRSRRSGIAPCSTLGFACFPRIAPCSAFSARRRSPILLGVQRLAPCASCGLLRTQRLAPVLVTDHSVPRIAPCSALETPPRIWIAPYTTLSLHASLLDYSTLAAFCSTSPHGSLRKLRLALCAGLRITPYANTCCPCSVHGLLRVPL